LLIILVINKEIYKEEYENISTDYWNLDINGKVNRLNELIIDGYNTDERYQLESFINQWNLRCGKLLSYYDKSPNKDRLESPEKYMISKFIQED
jgi:hypothetical protein